LEQAGFDLPQKAATREGGGVSQARFGVCAAAARSRAGSALKADFKRYLLALTARALEEMKERTRPRQDWPRRSEDANGRW